MLHRAVENLLSLKKTALNFLQMKFFRKLSDLSRFWTLFGKRKNFGGPFRLPQEIENWPV